ncbi:phage tail protein [Simonsiella muelleri]|uniref:TipJ family phage tail tip protein n=1 Tax=Simonsiella muelleri TaxID=72 RepID=UPI0028D0A422|nr:phage tail protein [Simonsiella muelleri]
MGSQKGGGARTPYEAPNTLNSAQNLRIIDAISEGEISGFAHGNDAPFKSIYFDDTPVQNADGSFNFHGVTGYFQVGTPDQSYIPNFDVSERTVSVSTNVKKNTPIIRTISDNTINRLRVTVGVERNAQVKDNGDTVPANTELVIELLSNSGVQASRPVVFNEKGSGAFYHDVVFDSLPAVPFNIRVRRLTADGTSDKVANNTFFASYVEMIDAKLSYPHTALSALKVDSDQFGNNVPRRNYLLRGKLLQVPSNYDPETRTYAGSLWDGSFKTAWTNNPAWVFYDLLTNERYSTLAHRLTAGDIDKWALYQIAKYCDELVPDGFGGQEPRFVCNAYITDQRQAGELLNDLASVFCGLAVWNGNQISVMQDKHTDPVAVYSNANVVDGEFSYAGASLKAIHTAVHVRYADKHDGYRSKVEYIADDEAVARYGLNIKSVTAFGCDSRGQAVRFGAWILQTELRQQNTVSFSVGREGLKHLPYDVIRIADNDYVGAQLGGRVVAVLGDTITLDRDVSQAVGALLYYVDVISGSLKNIKIIAQPKNNQVRVETAISIKAGDTWGLTSKVKSRLYRAVSIKENADDGTYTITALLHDPAKYGVVDESAIFDDAVNTLHSATPELNNATLSSKDGGVVLLWDNLTADGAVLNYDIKIFRNNILYRHIPDAQTAEIRLENLPNGNYKAEIRGRNARGVLSKPLIKAWQVNYEITGLRTRAKTLAVELTWTLPEILTTTAHTEIWYANTNSFQAAKKLVKLPAPQNSYTLMGVGVLDTFYFWARLVDENGNSGAFTEAVMGKSDPDPAPIVANIHGAITETELSKSLINQFNKNDEAAKNAAIAVADTKMLAEVQARLAADRAEAQARANAIAAETTARTSAINQAAAAQTAALKLESSKLAGQIQVAATTAQTNLQTKAAELTANATVLGNRISAMENVNNQQVQQLNTLTAAQRDTIAALETEKRARADGDAAESAKRETLAAKVAQNTADISREATASAERDRAQTAAREVLTARLDNVRVGGRNYLKNSNFTNELQHWVNWGVAERTLISGSLKLAANDTAPFRGIAQTVYDLEQNTQYILSFTARSAVGGFVNLGIHFRNDTTILSQNWQNIAIGSEMVRYSAIFTTPNVAEFNQIYLMMGGVQKTPYEIYLNKIKLERGNTPTDWTLAPEDLAAETAAVAAELSEHKTAQVTKDAAQTQQIQAATARLGAAESGLQSLQATVANEKSATATQLGSLKSAIDGAKADLSAYQKTQATKDAAQTAELTSAKSQIGDNKAAIAAIRSTKADKTEVVNMARTGLQSEWRSDVNAAKTAAATDAQAKADAAKQAAITAAETAATAKANAAKAAAVAESAQTAQSKADAAKAAAIADAATKDAVLKRQAADDATAKANAAKAEMAQANAATNAKITALEQTVSNQNSSTANQISTLTAKVDNVQIGGRNLAIAAQFERGKWVSEANGAININGQHRLSGLIAVQYNTQYVVSTDKLLRNVRVAWFDGEQQFISGILKLNADNGWVLTAPENAAFARFSYDFIISQTQNVQFERGNIRTDYEAAPEDLAAETAAVVAELREYKTAQATLDTAQTAEINSVKSQIGNNKSVIDSMRSTKADKTEVASLARTTLQSEWQTVATNASNAAKLAAATDAQAKADVAKAAAIAAADTAATAKANAAKAEAIASASNTAQSKADAAKAAAIADAATKDAVLKRQAADDATAKANAAKAEMAQANAATNAKITALEQTVSNQNRATASQISTLTAKVDNVQVGGRNYVLNSNREFTTWGTFALSPDLTAEKLRGASIVVSCDVEFTNLQNSGSQNRIGAEFSVSFEDNTRSWLGAWATNTHQTGSAKKRISAVLQVADKPIRSIAVMGIYNQTGNSTAKVSKPKLEIGTIATDWTPAPEDGEAATAAVAAELMTHKTVQASKDAAQTAELTSAKSQIGDNKAAITAIRSTKADKTEVVSMARTGLQSEWQSDVNAAKSQAATDAQTKADAAKVAAIADAATKDAVLKRQAADDATAKANAAKAEMAQANAATNAKITALEQTVSNQNSATATQLNELKASFSKASGANLLPNAHFADWTGVIPQGWFVYNNLGSAAPHTVSKVIDGIDKSTAIRIAWTGAVGDSKGIYTNLASWEKGEYYIVAVAARIPDGQPSNCKIVLTNSNAPAWQGVEYLAQPVLNKTWQWTVAKMRKPIVNTGAFNQLYITVSRDFTGTAVELCLPYASKGEVWTGYKPSDNQTDVLAVKAELTAHKQAQATADAAQTAEINAAKSRLGTAESGLETLRQTVATNQSATTTQINSLNSKVGTAEANIRTAQTATTTLNGKVQALHTLKVETVAGGRKAVAGLALGADGATGDSQFIVQANKFAIHDGALRPVFVTVTQNGKTQTAISGDLIADGTILGKHLAASQTINAPSISGGTISGSLITGTTIRGAKLEAVDLEAANIVGDVINGVAFANEDNRLICRIPSSRKTKRTLILPQVVARSLDGQTVKVQLWFNGQKQSERVITSQSKNVRVQKTVSHTFQTPASQVSGRIEGTTVTGHIPSVNLQTEVRGQVSGTVSGHASGRVSGDVGGNVGSYPNGGYVRGTVSGNVGGGVSGQVSGWVGGHVSGSTGMVAVSGTVSGSNFSGNIPSQAVLLRFDITFDVPYTQPSVGFVSFNQAINAAACTLEIVVLVDDKRDLTPLDDTAGIVCFVV